MLGNRDKKTYVYLKDDPVENSQLGVTQNRIVEVPNFVTPEQADAMIKYFDIVGESEWQDIAFYKSQGAGIPPEDSRLEPLGLPADFFGNLRVAYRECVSLIFERPVRPNTSHAQKWYEGGYASPHSDNSDFNGNPSAFEINKYVGILYLNDNYEGGELYFPDHNLEIKPNKCSYYVFPGGVENIHGVRKIEKGERYTMVSFWDFEEAEYSEERKQQWEEEFSLVREEQEFHKGKWEAGSVANVESE